MASVQQKQLFIANEQTKIMNNHNDGNTMLCAVYTRLGMIYHSLIKIIPDKV